MFPVHVWHGEEDPLPLLVARAEQTWKGALRCRMGAEGPKGALPLPFVLAAPPASPTTLGFVSPPSALQHTPPCSQGPVRAHACEGAGTRRVWGGQTGGHLSEILSDLGSLSGCRGVRGSLLRG